jgi:hypothetical protein
MKHTLTTLQAFNAMTKFLDDYYNKTKSDDVGSLLGDMSFSHDGFTADPGTWADWIDAVRNKQSVSTVEAYKAMLQFLDYYRKNTSSKDIEALLETMQLDEQNRIKDKDISTLWTKCVDQASNEPEGSRHYLELRK